MLHNVARVVVRPPYRATTLRPGLELLREEEVDVRRSAVAGCGAGREVPEAVRIGEEEVGAGVAELRRVADDGLQDWQGGQAVRVLLRADQVDARVDAVVELDGGGAERAVVRDLEHVDSSGGHCPRIVEHRIADLALSVVGVAGVDHAEQRCRPGDHRPEHVGPAPKEGHNAGHVVEDAVLAVGVLHIGNGLHGTLVVLDAHAVTDELFMDSFCWADDIDRREFHAFHMACMFTSNPLGSADTLFENRPAPELDFIATEGTKGPQRKEQGKRERERGGRYGPCTGEETFASKSGGIRLA
ncbi:hypothetical protein P167DRAFT_415540 [Morchella conica CCBAS932]|uniref:Uncharacterized protein n=1 Tax=Morchella conica CCBAS932 TaxID=1392247 RepID=A0A3N4KNK1_9PEZI|nr:hypothetical protein P167DRAFT_415540 [Morchella conica CCBAS932]